MAHDPRVVRTDAQGRALVVGVVLIVAGSLCFGRLAQWQLTGRDRLLAAAGSRISQEASATPLRGTITDRSGSVVLASTVMRQQLIAQPSALSPEEKVSVHDTLVSRLNLNEEASARVLDGLGSTRSWSLLLTGLDDQAAATVRSAAEAGLLPGISLQPTRMRYYPQPGGGAESSLASHVLGFVNGEGVGQYGIEGYYDQLLAGTSEVTRIERGSDGIDRQVQVSAALPGADLELCIDAGLQTLVEQEVATAGVANQAESVSVVVMDPFSGDVVSSASWPSYDANNFSVIAARDPSRFQDPAISSVFEPGSVMKAITSVAGLESGVVTPQTVINDQTVLRLDDGVNAVRNADHRSKGAMTLSEAFAWSRNVVFSKVALSLGKSTSEASQRLYATWLRFGFGGETGIDLSGESQGLVNSPNQQRWSELDLANGSFGQGISTTLMQLTTAYAALVNGGVLIRPRVVHAVNGVEQPITTRGVATSAKVSTQLIEMTKGLTRLVPLYSRLSSIPQYASGGKSGTAQIWLTKAERGGKAGWDKHHFNFTFVGWIGRTAPEYVIGVSIRRGTPVVNLQGNILNNVESFELFRRIAEDLTSLFKIPPAAPALGDGSTSPAHHGAPEPSAPVGLLVGGDPLRRQMVMRRT